MMSDLEMRFLLEYVIWVQALHTSQLPPYRVDSYLSRHLNHLFLRCNLTAKDRTLGFSVSKLLGFECCHVCLQAFIGLAIATFRWLDGVASKPGGAVKVASKTKPILRACFIVDDLPVNKHNVFYLPTLSPYIHAMEAFVRACLILIP